MSNYTITQLDIEDVYARSVEHLGIDGREDFRAWLAEHDAQVRAEALREQADREPSERHDNTDTGSVVPPSDAEVEAAAEALWDMRRDHEEDPPWGDRELHAKFEESCRVEARAALLAAQEVRDAN